MPNNNDFIAKAKSLGYTDEQIRQYQSLKQSGQLPVKMPVVNTVSQVDTDAALHSQGMLQDFVGSGINAGVDMVKSIPMITGAVNDAVGGPDSVSNAMKVTSDAIEKHLKYTIAPDYNKGIIELNEDGSMGLTNFRSLFNGLGNGLGQVGTALLTGGESIYGRLAANTLMNFPSVYDSAEKAGLNKQDAAKFSLLLAPILGATEEIGGVQPYLAKNLLGNVAATETKQIISKLRNEAISETLEKAAKGELTEEAFGKLAKETSVKYLEKIKALAPGTLKEMAGEGGQEMFQDGIQQGAEQIYDKFIAPQNAQVGQGKFGTELITTDPNAQLGGINVGGYGITKKGFVSLANNGILGGIIGGTAHMAIHQNPEFLQQTLFSYIDDNIKNEKGEDAMKRINALVNLNVQQQKITPQDGEIMLKKAQQIYDVADRWKGVEHEGMSNTDRYKAYDLTSNVLPMLDGPIKQFETTFQANDLPTALQNIDTNEKIDDFQKGAMKKSAVETFGNYWKATQKRDVIKSYLQQLGTSGKATDLNAQIKAIDSLSMNDIFNKVGKDSVAPKNAATKAIYDQLNIENDGEGIQEQSANEEMLPTEQQGLGLQTSDEGNQELSQVAQQGKTEEVNGSFNFNLPTLESNITADEKQLSNESADIDSGIIEGAEGEEEAAILHSIGLSLESQSGIGQEQGNGTDKASQSTGERENNGQNDGANNETSSKSSANTNTSESEANVQRYQDGSNKPNTKNLNQDKDGKVQNDGRTSEESGQVNTETTASEGQTSGVGKKQRKRAKGTPKSRRSINDPNYKKALSHEIESAEDLALKAFIGGAKIQYSVIDKMYRNAKGEAQKRISFLSKDGFPTIDAMAHSLWEDGQIEEFGYQKFSAEVISNAIEDVLNSHYGTRSMVDDINSRFDIEKKNPEEDENYIAYLKEEQEKDKERGYTQTQIDDAYAALYGMTEQEIEDFFNDRDDAVLQMHLDSLDEMVSPEEVIQERIDSAQNALDEAEAILSKAESDYNKKKENFEKNPSENQTDMFGQNKTPSMFDDKAQQQEILNQAKNKVDSAREAVSKAKEKLQLEIDKVGQSEIEFNEKPTTETTSTTSNQSDIEAKKADIERRRQEELNQKHDAGYSTIALDYLFTGGRDVILSTDYLLQALVGGFTNAATEINNIRNKYADKLGNIKDDINSDVYNQMMNEIRNVINKNYNDSKANEIFDKILKNATGFISREGNQVSIELDKLNEQNESKINAKYDAELKAVESLLSKEQTPTASDVESTAKVIEDSNKWYKAEKQIKDKDGNDITLTIDKNKEDNHFYIKATDSKGNEVGSALFETDNGKVWSGNEIEVNEGNRRKGIMSAMYDFAESEGHPLEPTKSLSKEGKAFWENRKSESLLSKEQPKEQTPTASDVESTAKALEGIKNKKLNSKEGEINTGNIEVVKTIPNVDKVIGKDKNGNEIKVLINGDKLKGTLLSKGGNYLFKAMQGRVFTLAKVGDFYLPFYISSAGTSGKIAGEWYPFFGYNNWLVKGRVGAKGEMVYSQKILDVQKLLNENFILPAKYLAADNKVAIGEQFVPEKDANGNIIREGKYNFEKMIPNKNRKVLYDLSEDIDIITHHHQEQKGETKLNEHDWVAEKTGLNPKNVVNDGGNSADNWINDIIALTENAELASKGVIKSTKAVEHSLKETTKAEKSSIEKIDDEIANLWDDLASSIGAIKKFDGNGGPDPKALEIGIKLVSLYTKKGIYQLSDMAKDMAERFGEAAKDLLPYLKDAYNSVRGRSDREDRKKFNTEDEVFDFELKNEQDGTNDTGTVRQPIEQSSKGNGRNSGNVDRAPKGKQEDLFSSTTESGGTEKQGNTETERISSGRGTVQNNGSSGGRGRGISEGRTLFVADDKPENFTLPDNFGIKTFNPKVRFSENLDALKIVVALKNENRAATKEEQDKLSRYVGWGGLGVVLANQNTVWTQSDEQLRPLVVELDGVISELEKAGFKDVKKHIKASVSTSHYTPIPVIKSMYSALMQLGFKHGNILDPSAGIGHFFGAMPTSIKNKSSLTSVEIEPLTAFIHKSLYPNATGYNTGYEDANLPDGNYDLVVSNVPFGQLAVYDKKFNTPELKSIQGKIHNYFFAKAIQQAKEGGLVAFITSSGTLNSRENENIRKYISKNAEFIGAIRLPSSTFQGNAGTQVVSDVIFLKKNSKGNAGGIDFNTIVEIEVPHKSTGEETKIDVNKYFVDNPGNVIGEFKAGGQYRADEMTVIQKDGTDIAAEMQKAIENTFPKSIYSKVDTFSQKNTLVEIQESKDIHENELYIGKDGMPYKSNGEGVEPTSIAKKYTPKLVAQFIALRDTLKRQYELESDTRASENDIENNRHFLNKYYEGFVSKFGNLHKSSGLILKDVNGFNVLSLETKDDNSKTYRKADILSRRVIKVVTRPTSAENINDAINISLDESGFIDENRVASLLGQSVENVISSHYGELFYDSDGKIVDRATYLSGNVKKKLAEAIELSKTNALYEKNVEELEKVQPEDIPASSIDVNIGARWVPVEIYKKFVSEILNSNVDIIYSKAKDEYTVSGNETVESKEKYGTSRISAYRLIELAMAGQSPVIRDKVSSDPDKYVVNKDETQKAQEKQEEVIEMFGDWIWKDSSRRDSLGALYNAKFNTTVKKKYNGSYLHFDGMNDEVKLAQHQLDGASMLIANKGGIIDHIVGAGKTYLMIAAAIKMKRMGIINKPVIAGLKSTIPHLISDAKKLYPGAKILSPSQTDFNAKNRKAFLSKIQNNDWDLIIMSHEQFGSIPQDTEMQIDVMNEEIEMLDMEIALLEAESGKSASKKVLKGLEARKNTLVSKLKELMDAPKDIEILNFKQIGIDKIFIDESQMFKNLEYSTRINRVAGLGNPKGSKRALNLLTAIRTLQKHHGGDMGTTFLSGTPISNSLVEMYLLFKYLRPNKMNELGYKTFDSWVKQFAVASNAIEFAVTGSVKQNTRFRSFINIPELSMLYSEITDLRNDDNLVLPKPKIKGGEPKLVLIKQSEYQKEWTQRLIEFAKQTHGDRDGSLIGKGELTESEQTAAMLMVTGISNKLSIDMRLIDKSAEDNPTGKLSAVAQKVYEDYVETEAIKGTQLIFCDTGTPKTKNTVENLKGYMEDELNIQLDDINSVFGEEGAPLPPIATVKERLATALEWEPEYIESVINESKNAEGQFNVYDELKRKLIEKGVPENQVVFIHSYNTAKAKEALFDAVNNGDIRVVIGSTQKLGTGVNCQRRIVSLHHIDAQWNPAAMEQRNGRGIRQKNMNAEVGIYYYGTELTLDAYKYQLIATKQKFINQVKSGTLSEGERSVREDDGEDMGMDSMVAVLSGNPLLFEKAKTDNIVDKMKRSRKNFFAEIYNAESKIDSITASIPNIESEIEKRKADLDKAKSFGYNEEGTRIKTVAEIVGGKPYETTKELGEQIISQKNQILQRPVGHTQVIGTVNGMKLQGTLVKTMDTSGLFQNSLSVELKLVGDLAYGITSSSDPTSQGVAIGNAINKLQDGVRSTSERLNMSKVNLIKYKELSKKTWDKQSEYDALIEKQKKINDELKAQEKAENGTRDNEDDNDAQFATGPQTESTENQKQQSQTIIDFFQRGLKLDVFAPASEYESALAETTKGKELRSDKGQPIGFVKNGKIYLNPNTITPEMTFHELIHIQQQLIKSAAVNGDAQAEMILKRFNVLLGDTVSKIMNGNRNVSIDGVKIDLSSSVYDRADGETDLQYRERLRDELWAYIQAPVNEKKWNEGTSGIVSRFIEAVKKFFKDKLGLKNADNIQSMTLGELIDASANSLIKGEFMNSQPKTIKVDGKSVNVKNADVEVVDGFYSPLENIIAETKAESLPAKQWAEKYANSEEAKWTGLKDWLAKQQGSVSKADIQQYLKDNRIQVVEVVKTQKDYRDDWDKENDNPKDLTKFSQYQLEGEKENYKEVLVTMPIAKSIQEYEVEQDYRTPNTFYAVNKKTGVKLKFGSYELAKSQAERLSKEAQPDFDKQFKSSHFDEPNILVHLRMNTRTDAQGNKVLFLEEVQSDWGQKGKKEGFKELPKYKESDFDYSEPTRYLTDNSGVRSEVKAKEWESKDGNYRITYNPKIDQYVVNSTRVQNAHFDSLKDAIDNINTPREYDKLTPLAPFVTDTNSWTKLGLKVALKEAVKQGADKIAWTTGEQQNERYDLSKQVDWINAEKTKKGDYKIEVGHKDGRPMETLYLKETELEANLGKELATKIVNDGGGMYKGLDLQVGGSGMKGFYGSPTENKLGIVGNVAKSLFKQEVKTTDIILGKNAIADRSIKDLEKTFGEQRAKEIMQKGSQNDFQQLVNEANDNGFEANTDDLYSSVMTANQYETYNKTAQTTTQHSIDITPELRAQTEQGLPLFAIAQTTTPLIEDIKQTPELSATKETIPTMSFPLELVKIKNIIGSGVKKLGDTVPPSVAVSDYLTKYINKILEYKAYNADGTEKRYAFVGKLEDLRSSLGKASTVPLLENIYGNIINKEPLTKEASGLLNALTEYHIQYNRVKQTNDAIVIDAENIYNRDEVKAMAEKELTAGKEAMRVKLLENSKYGKYIANALEKYTLAVSSLPTWAKILAGGENSMLHKLVKALDSAQDKQYVMAETARDYISEIQNAIGTGSIFNTNDINKSASSEVGKHFEKYDGIKTKISDGELLHIYLTLKNDQVRNRFFSKGETGVFELKEYRDKNDKVLREHLSIEVTPSDYDKLDRKFSSPDWDSKIKAWTNANEFLYGYVNKTHMEETGVALRKAEGFYYPLIHGKGIKSYEDYLKQNKFVDDLRSAKARNPERNANYLVVDAVQLMNNYVDANTKYASYATPLKNIDVYLKVSDEFFRKNDMMKYVDWYNKFKKEFEDPTPDKVGEIEKRILSGFVISRLGLNPFVTLKQYSSIFVSNNVIPSKYLVSSLDTLAKNAGGVIKSFIPGKTVEFDSVMKEMLEHSATARRRLNAGQNYFDQMVKSSIKDFETVVMGKNIKIPFSKMTNNIMAADRAVSALYWVAAKKQVSAEMKMPTGSTEYWNAVNDIYTKAVIESQSSMDDVNRPHITKDAGILVKGLTLFSGQSFSNFNSFMGSVIEHANNPSKDNKMKVARSIMNIYVYNALMVAAIDSLKYAQNGDDEDKLKKKSFRSLISNSYQNIPLIAPIVDEVWSKVENPRFARDINYPVLQVINDGASVLGNLSNEKFDKAITEGIKFGGEAIGMPAYPMETFQKIYAKK